MSIVWNPDCWGLPKAWGNTSKNPFGEKYEHRVLREVNKAAAWVGEMDTAYIQIETGENQAKHVVAVTYVNGVMKEEGWPLPSPVSTGASTVDDIIELMLERLVPRVRGKKIWWRLKPQLFGLMEARITSPDEILRAENHPIDWYIRCRIGIDE